MVKVNGKSVVTIVDTGRLESIVLPQCVQKSEYLRLRIPFTTTREE